MKSIIRFCHGCRTYTLRNTCPRCGDQTRSVLPPRFSMEDPYGKYRIKLRKEYGFFLGRK